MYWLVLPMLLNWLMALGTQRQGTHSKHKQRPKRAPPKQAGSRMRYLGDIFAGMVPTVVLFVLKRIDDSWIVNQARQWWYKPRKYNGKKSSRNRRKKSSRNFRLRATTPHIFRIKRLNEKSVRKRLTRRNL